LKRCPQCNRVETDETLKFCRNDGGLLIDDTSLIDESSATRILPASQTGEAVGHSDTVPPHTTTSALDARKDWTTGTGEPKEAPSASRIASRVAAIKRHKIAALISLLVIVAGIVGISFYLRGRSSEVTIGSIAVLPFVNQNNDPNTEYLSRRNS
jgi:hypothetical protein